MTGKPASAGRPPTAGNETPGSGPRQNQRRADKTQPHDAQRARAARPGERPPGRPVDNAASAEARRERGPEAKKGPPRRRRERVMTHAPRPVSTTPVALNAERSTAPAPAVAPRPPATPIIAEKETEKAPERKVFIYTYTIWNRSTSP